ncbi:MAG: hypothetical protein MI757_10815 [Pirellulales bacterium]|nr:hypothetical protein [Pirellulales bacterium]
MPQQTTVPDDVDIYRDWLGIKDPDRPLNNYQLLKLPRFEDDAAKIRERYRKLNSHVRKYSSGQYAKQSQQLLNELARAMLCLTDARRKSEYDASLGRTTSTESGSATLEEILLSRQEVTTADLDKGRSFANAVGFELRDALVQQKLVDAEVVMQAYADSVGLPFVQLSETPIDEELVPKLPATLARLHSCVPVMIDDGSLLVASPNIISPEVEEELRLRLSMPVRSLICTPAQINDVINKHYSREAASAEMAGKPVVRGSDDEEEKESLWDRLKDFLTKPR